MPRVVVTGLGVVCPVGDTLDECFDHLVGARSGVSLIRDDIMPGNHALVAAQIAFDPLAHWPAHQAAQYDRSTQLALVAADRALTDASLPLDDGTTTHAGVYWGTGLGGANAIEDSYRLLFETGHRARPTAVVMGMNNAAAANISISHRLRGAILNVSTACSSSAVAIGEAYRAIRGGYADVIVAGGSEALLTYGNLRAWDAMRAIAHADASDPTRSCKPFSANRSGLVLGEGAAALILESDERAERRGARVYAELAGYGNASDAVGISRPDADGQIRAMRAAFADGGVPPEDIGYINAHGTATPIGDVVETSAIKTVFGGHAARVCVSSTKALHGHLIGAAGALEAIISILALTRGIVPPTAHLDEPDPACDLDYVPHTGRAVELGAVMSNSFGFGGMNAVLIARRYRA